MKLLKKFILFAVCGLIYVVCEILFRGFSHISMFLLAGFCGVFIIDSLNNIFSFDMDYLLQITVATTLCTIAEGFTGILVNKCLNLNVWDYSNLPLTFFYGQCNLYFVGAWALLVAVGIIICDAINYYILKDDSTVPYYKIFGKKVLEFKKIREDK